MRSIRNTWLAGLTCQQFQNLNPWEFVTHPESIGQWVAEVRSELSTRLRDDEILSILYPGLYKAAAAAIRNHGEGDPDRRGQRLIGYALQYIRIYGLAEVVDEIPGSGAFNVTELDTIEHTPRAHALQHSYMLTSAAYTESLLTQPQFLSDGIVLSDEDLQIRHQNIEQIRGLLSPREHQVLRLTVLECQKPIDMSDMLGLSKKQVWKIRRSLHKKLGEIAIAQGVSAEYVRSISKKAVHAEAE